GISHDRDVLCQFSRSRSHRATTGSASSTTIAATRLLAVCWKSRLQGRNLLWSDRPRGGVATLDRISAHLVNVVQKRLTVARGDIQHSPSGRELIRNRLREVPLLGLDRHRQIALREQLLRYQRNLDGRRVSNRLREQSDHVVEVNRGP